MCVAVTLQKGREGVDFPAALSRLLRVFTLPMEAFFKSNMVLPIKLIFGLCQIV